MRLADFDYHLPEHLIAQFPPERRGASRLLHVENKNLADRMFVELPTLLRTGDVLVFNDTRVVKARLHGQKQTGGQIEVLVERMVGEFEALAQIKASKSPKPGSALVFAGYGAEVVQRDGEFYLLRFNAPVEQVLEAIGKLPLPPYISHNPTGDDAERYQTVYANESGAVAAPTAGLHFDQAMLDQLSKQGVGLHFLTLHVGAGTFQPVRTEEIAQHRMHRERYWLPEATINAIRQAKANGGRVIAVGTTSLRALEASCLQGDFAEPVGDTDIFITPGFQFKVVDRLITNFHLPKSTLLMLVAAFAGHDVMQHAYAHAVACQYRFFSYGDAMLLERAPA
ncbi:tRNA preQ1(34) S-adenosylmethionine ribosyltransferase-isomerase QueA [Parachitinimonas caeni]|uniref:S-adenosylmethionine:tRNA ribosyltransferase-isomerase n=1 Tax=Parachitinimonas caeni TaxID=3031301 RepID=A0ABT7DVB9_9NEIS|nr:tRNA preQ1(34) S-adenosylmethionine ribosyltransferase-isomerase QueA [Parachitinimonas caeni]MDK2124011.1 tRNA preQ1(34) S-adenosylmethionine ribosyltransferase-isomerase QueA [Parachitinimonas caeni]